MLLQYRDSLRLARRRKYALKSNLSYDEHDDIFMAAIPRTKSSSSLHSRRHSSFSTFVTIYLKCSSLLKYFHRVSTTVDASEFETSSVKSFSSNASTTDEQKSRLSWMRKSKTTDTTLKTKSVDDILFNVHRVDNLLMA